MSQKTEEDIKRERYLAEKNSETVVCPFNPAHVVKKRKFNKHKAGCPDNPAKNPTFGKSYMNPNCNIDLTLFEAKVERNIRTETLLPFLDNSFFDGFCDESKKSQFYTCKCSTLTLNLFTESALRVLVQRVYTLYTNVKEMYNDILAPIDENVDLNCQEEKVELQRYEVSMPDGWEFPSKKHTEQCLSIVSHLIEKNILKPNESQEVIESGAGSGMLSAYYSLSKRSAPSKFYMVDCMKGMRKKYDRFMRRYGDTVFRVPADLRNVDGLTLVQSHEQASCHSTNICVIGKHLCGSATDMALQMAVKCKDRLGGIGIALCCHAKGDGHYDCIADFFLSRGISVIELTAIHRLTSWALTVDNLDTEWKKEQVIVAEMCRNIINVARIVWLKSQSNIHQAGLVKYCKKSMSPENVLLWAN
ncbi:hypothetical protein EIN_221870 [Entamoeba invadens IP1]|uniref:tRNA:m(4)X modification enzyme TRM13 n=1 Tax=Entamoeba invadens IP1 TaxID=370355 RepID=A0A0A1U219_ENTIV|nr:hypothetical protein EIN_221870 [Entamoeba invadens IP1]ELP88054.1 hypothetical protein EIN_221870 [Entamoeba invadens IP1]|eukprot:XP_004254825.1 hypothetical protein EIN_221870 [Entamoeba invadens IP1]